MKKQIEGLSAAREENFTPHFPSYSSRILITTTRSCSVGNGEPKNIEVSLAECFLEPSVCSVRISEG